MSINILKIEDKDKFCVEIIRNSGDIGVMRNIFVKLKKFFGAHVNSVSPCDWSISDVGK